MTGSRIDGDPAETNRGLGQERVGEPGPGPAQRPLDPAAGGPGHSTGPTTGQPKHQRPMKGPAKPDGHGTYGQGDTGGRPPKPSA